MKKTKGSPVFSLRCDPLRGSIAAALLIQPVLAMGEGIAPVAGPGGTPVVGYHKGVPVIGIVAPSNGLSHNQFSEYQVPLQGLVLNNALAAGTSRLAGALAANPQLNGQAASTILNEVVGQLPSNIRGTQEIFGQAADYVLANPNGIHIQGIGFINTPRAVFLVGTPEIQDGRLTGLNTFSAPGDLRISGSGLTTSAAVDLIAPRIDSSGQLDAGPALNAIVGRNRVTADTVQVVETRQRPGEWPGIDLHVLGAMRAGRIRLISTRDGAGIRLAGRELIAQAGLSVSAAGDVRVGRDGAEGKSILSGGRGELNLQARQDISIVGSRLTGRDVRARAGRDLTLDAATREKLRERRDGWNKKAWFITTETWSEQSEERSTELHATTLTALRDAELTAGRHLKVRGSDLHAEDALRLKAGKNVTIEAGVEHTALTRETHHRKHLWREDKTEANTAQKARPSELTAGSITIDAGNKATIRGSNLSTPGDLTVSAKAIEVDAQALKRRATRDGYRGDLTSGFFFGKNGERTETGTRQHGSVVKAGGTARLVSDDVRIGGSKVHGDKGTLVVGDKKAVVVESVAEITYVSERSSNTQLGGAFGSKNTSSDTRKKHLGGSVSTEGDMQLLGEKVQIKASTATAAGKLEIKAKQNLEITSATNTHTQHASNRQGSLVASAGETRPAEDGKEGSKQYGAGVGYEHKRTTVAQTAVNHQQAAISGRTLVLEAGETVKLIGAGAKSTQGDLDIKAKALEVISVLDETRKETRTRTSQGGLEITAGIDKVGSAFTGSHHNESNKTQQSTASRAALKAAGDININVSDSAEYIGAELKAGGKLNENAPQITRKALAEVDNTETTRSNWEGKLGASIDWKDLVQPIKKAIEGKEQTKFQQTGVEDALLPPSLGADAGVTHVNREHGVRVEQPVVTRLSGAQVNTTVDGLLQDEGSQYDAKQSPLDINAGEHQFIAAKEVHRESRKTLDAEGGLRLFTVTGSDLNVKLNGSGNAHYTLDDRSTAVTGQMNGAGGVAVQLGTDGLYEGTGFNAGNGTLTFGVGGDLALVAAQNRQHKEQTTTTGYGLAMGGTAPAGKNGLLMGGVDHSTLTSTDTQSVGGSIKAAQGKATVGGDARFQGVSINNGKQATEAFKVEAGGITAFTALVDTHEAKGQQLGGALQLSANRNPAADADRTGGGIGGHLDVGRVSEQSRSERGVEQTIKDLAVTAQAYEQKAIQLEGVQLAGDNLALNAPNGGIVIDAAQSTEQKDNLRVAGGAGVNGSRGLSKEDDASALYARAKVDVDKVDSTTHQNADVRVKQLSLGSALDTRLEGAVVAAERVSGSVGGDLLLSSAQDQVYSTQVKVDARIAKEHNPQGLLNGLNAVTGPLAEKAREKLGKPVQAVDANLTPTLLLDVVREQREHVAKATTLSGREGINLNVGGDTLLTGAKLRAGQGKVELGGSEVKLSDLNGRDYRADVSINATSGPVDLLTNVVNELTAKRSEQAKADEHGNLGVIRTGGHDRQQAVAAAVEERR